MKIAEAKRQLEVAGYHVEYTPGNACVYGCNPVEAKGRAMHLIDPTNDNDRRKASAHYRRMAKHAQRQIKWRNFFHRPHFAFFDMIVCAFLAAVLSASLVYLLTTR